MTERIKIKLKNIMILVMVLLSVSVIYFFVTFENDRNINTDAFRHVNISLPESPLNASYKINNEEIKLLNGSANIDGVKINVVDAPVLGDINGDKVNDAVLLLNYSKNSTSSKYLLALAIYDKNGFLGMNAVRLNNFEKPSNIIIEDEFVSVEYRKEDISAEYFIFTGISLTKVNLQNDDKIFKGIIKNIDGKYVFMDCLNVSSSSTYVLYDKSKSKAAIDAIYKEKTRENNTSINGVYMVFGGEVLIESNVLNLSVEKIISVPQNLRCEK